MTLQKTMIFSLSLQNGATIATSEMHVNGHRRVKKQGVI